jgi:hypothetical protein
MDLSKYFPEVVPNELGDMYSYLTGTRSIPQIKTVGTMPEDGDLGSYNRNTNTINLLGGQGMAEYQNSMMHEFQHAVHNQIGNQFLAASSRKRGLDYSPMDSQLVDAYHKFMLPSKLPANEIPDKGYRWDTPDERLAYGITNSVLPTSVSSVPPHLDATMATEASILRDIARRQANQVQQTPPSFLSRLFGK